MYGYKVTNMFTFHNDLGYLIKGRQESENQAVTAKQQISINHLGF